LLEKTRFKSVEVKATEGRPIEQMPLSGQADVGFDCGRLHSPFIRYRLVKSEPLTVVLSPALKLKGKVRRVQDLLQFPHIEYTRISAEQRLGLGERIRNISFVGDSIASCRTACVTGLGWALLPVYSVHAELQKNVLGLLDELKCEEEKFGVWQLRSFPNAGLMEQATN
jgi:DNA-binding transcriptional LysR family regulator